MHIGNTEKCSQNVLGVSLLVFRVLEFGTAVLRITVHFPVADMVIHCGRYGLFVAFFSFRLMWLWPIWSVANVVQTPLEQIASPRRRS